MARRLIVRACNKFEGAIRPPSDKSLTHRAYMFAAMANSGVSVVRDPLNGEDCESTLECLQTLGATVHRVSEKEVRVSAIEKWADYPVTLNCGNSGTTMRLMCGVIAGRTGVDATLIGDQSLSKRPMGRITKPLSMMGANISGDTAPVHILGSKLEGLHYDSPVASAQIKSAILLAGLGAEGKTSVVEPSLSRDHTERMFEALGVHLYRQGTTVYIEGVQSWGSFEFAVPGDISSAAFFIVAALAHRNSEVTFRDLGINPTRTGILDVVSQMGIAYTLTNEHEELGEPVANVTFHAPSELNPFVIEGDLVPRLIDEIPVLAVLATQCHGTSIIRDAGELRVKETDRIAVVTKHLADMGANIEATADGMIIHGPTPLHGATVDSSGDHRIGMSFAIAGSLATGETIIENADAINTSYPEFADHFHHLSGVALEVAE